MIIVVTLTYILHCIIWLLKSNENIVAAKDINSSLKWVGKIELVGRDNVFRLNERQVRKMMKAQLKFRSCDLRRKHAEASKTNIKKGVQRSSTVLGIQDKEQ